MLLLKKRMLAFLIDYLVVLLYGIIQSHGKRSLYDRLAGTAIVNKE